MATIQTKVLKGLKESKIGLIPINDSLPDEELAVLQKLELFGVVRSDGRSFRPDKRFHQYVAILIEQETPIEQFDFDDQPKAPPSFTNIFHGSNSGQINQGSGNFSFEQINIEIIKKSLENELTEEQLDDVMQALKEKGKNGVFQKLKSFGGDVLANIIAGILSNPGLYG